MTRSHCFLVAAFAAVSLAGLTTAVAESDPDALQPGSGFNDPPAAQFSGPLPGRSQAAAAAEHMTPQSPATQPAQQISIDNFSFSPSTITIPAGTTVTWTNRDDVPHTVTATDHAFDSKALDTDGKFTYVFAKPGTYTYFCAVHPHMKAQVVVR